MPLRRFSVRRALPRFSGISVNRFFRRRLPKRRRKRPLHSNGRRKRHHASCARDFDRIRHYTTLINILDPLILVVKRLKRIFLNFLYIFNGNVCRFCSLVNNFGPFFRPFCPFFAHPYAIKRDTYCVLSIRIAFSVCIFRFFVAAARFSRPPLWRAFFSCPLLWRGVGGWVPPPRFSPAPATRGTAPTAFFARPRNAGEDS